MKQGRLGYGGLVALATTIVLVCMLVQGVAVAGSWPGYRYDNARCGASPEGVKAPLHLQWTYVPRHKPRPAWPEPCKEVHHLAFDYSPQVVIAQGMVFFGSSADHKVYAIDLTTGRERWSFFTDGPVRFAPAVSGDRVLAASDDGRLYCLSARDGRLLWRTSSWQIGYANVPMPVPVGGGRVLLTGEYNAGAMMLQLTRTGDAVSGRELFRHKPKVFGAHQHTPIFYDGHVYSARQGRQLACMTTDGTVLWESGPGNRYGIGPYVIADGKIIIMDSKGNLSLIEATPKGFRPLARAKVLPGPDSWGAMVVVGGRLILRDLNVMKCLDLRAK